MTASAQTGPSSQQAVCRGTGQQSMSSQQRQQSSGTKHPGLTRMDGSSSILSAAASAAKSHESAVAAALGVLPANQPILAAAATQGVAIPCGVASTSVLGTAPPVTACPRDLSTLYCCWLCKRRFPSSATLDRHVLYSRMHQDAIRK